MEKGHTSDKLYDAWARKILALPPQIQNIRSSNLCCPNQCGAFHAFVNSIALNVGKHWQSNAVATNKKMESKAMGKKLLGVLKSGVKFVERCAEQVSVSTLVVSIGELNRIIDSVKGYSEMMNKLLVDSHCSTAQDKIETYCSTAQDEVESRWSNEEFYCNAGEDEVESQCSTIQDVLDEVEFHCRTAQEQIPLAYEQDKKLMDSLITQENPIRNLDGLLLDLDQNSSIADSVLLVENGIPEDSKKGRVVHGSHIGKVSGHLKRTRTLVLKYMNTDAESLLRCKFLFSLYDSVDMMLQIAAAMRDPHKYPDRYNVIHIDLKPCDNTVQTQAQTDFQTQADSDVYSFARVCETILRGKWFFRVLYSNIYDNLTAFIQRCLEPKQHNKRPTFEEICNHLWGVKEEILKFNTKSMVNTVIPAIETIELKIQECLGRGAHGVVSKAILWGNRPVAIKEFLHDEHFRGEYEMYKALQTINGLDTTHMVQLLGHTELSNGRHALIRELMDKKLERFIETRKEIKKESSPFFLYESVDIMYQIAKGIHNLHKVNVVHGDIKTANILLKTDDESHIVKLTANMYSSMYLATKMEEEEAEISKKVDIYSFGIVCIEILTGTPLMEEDLERDKLSRLPQGFPDDLGTIIRNCLEQEIQNRPTSGKIYEDLGRLREQWKPREQRKHVIPVIASRELVIREDKGDLKTGKWGSRPVAIKEFQNDEDFQDEYGTYNKLTTVDGLNMEQIVQVLGHTKLESNGRPALVRELMGTDLKTLLVKQMKKESRAFFLYESVDIMYQIAKGIHNLHKSNVVHRDIKTANILVETMDNVGFVIKLIACKVAFQTQSSHTQRIDSSMYLAEEEESRKEDIYSFGIVCIEILTGGQQDLTGGKIPCLPQGIPDKLGMIIRGCIEPEMQNRPTSERLVEDLGRLTIPVIASSELVIQENLGKGTYGIVWQAKWCSQPVAIKEFHYVEHFQYEYEIYNSLKAIDGLDTTHMVQILGRTKHGNNNALVIELMDRDLKSSIERRQQNSPVSLKESIDIMYQIAKGIHNLHKVDVVHRDIKPANVLLKTMQDRSVILKLTDCGTCKVDFHTHSDHTHYTGTKTYWAPEMEEEGAQISRKVDIYSFGVVCIEILTGKPPDAENLKRGEMPSFPQDIPDHLGNIIRCCIEEKTQNRPTSEEICKELSRLKEQLKDYDFSGKEKRRRLN